MYGRDVLLPRAHAREAVAKNGPGGNRVSVLTPLTRIDPFVLLVGGGLVGAGASIATNLTVERRHPVPQCLGMVLGFAGGGGGVYEAEITRRLRVVRPTAWSDAMEQVHRGPLLDLHWDAKGCALGAILSGVAIGAAAVNGEQLCETLDHNTTLLPRSRS
jgi:hypothetical protein